MYYYSIIDQIAGCVLMRKVLMMFFRRRPDSALKTEGEEIMSFITEPRIHILAIAGGLILLGAQIFDARPAASASRELRVHLRLVDRLDRPEDGYCLDIPGPPSNLFLDVPLFAHNCMPSLTNDTAVVFMSDGYIRFPAVDRCITVTGVKSALPGSSIMLNKCNPSNPFIDISRRQRFTHRQDGSLTVAGTELCLTVGPQSAVTLSPVHRWRTLFVDDCATADPARSRWEFVVPEPE